MQELRVRCFLCENLYQFNTLHHCPEGNASNTGPISTQSTYEVQDVLWCPRSYEAGYHPRLLPGRRDQQKLSRQRLEHWKERVHDEAYHSDPAIVREAEATARAITSAPGGAAGRVPGSTAHIPSSSRGRINECGGHSPCMWPRSLSLRALSFGLWSEW